MPYVCGSVHYHLEVLGNSLHIENLPFSPSLSLCGGGGANLPVGLCAYLCVAFVCLSMCASACLCVLACAWVPASIMLLGGLCAGE